MTADCVPVDDFGGTREAVRMLIARGHTKTAFLGLPPSAYTGAERHSGFCAAMAEAALPVDDAYVRYRQRDIAAAEQAATKLLALPDPPTALFAANNRNAIGAIRAINNTGASTELVGFDDFELAGMLGLPLGVVAYDPGEVGQCAANLLIDRLHGKSDGSTARRVVLPTKVIEYPGHPQVRRHRPEGRPEVPVRLPSPHASPVVGG